MFTLRQQNVTNKINNNKEVIDTLARKPIHIYKQTNHPVGRNEVKAKQPREPATRVAIP